MLLDEYDDLKFIKDDGTFDLTTNVIRITEATIKNYNLIPDSLSKIISFCFSCRLNNIPPDIK